MKNPPTRCIPTPVTFLDLANLNNELIDQTALEALDGVSCSAGCHVWQAASFPTDSLASLTVNYPVLFIVCANLPFVSPIRLSVLPYAIQNTVTQINAVVIRVMLRACLKSAVCRVRTAHQPLKAPEWIKGANSDRATE